MKYYSEKLAKMFSTEEELTKAEKEFEELKTKKEKQKTELALSKKKMAESIEKANSEIDDARENYAKVYEEAEKIINKARKEAEDLLNPARERIREAQYKKYNAVKEFNNKYGPYTVSYTGEKAYNEFKRSSDWMNYMINEFFL